VKHRGAAAGTRKLRLNPQSSVQGIDVAKNTMHLSLCVCNIYCVSFFITLLSARLRSACESLTLSVQLQIMLSLLHVLVLIPGGVSLIPFGKVCVRVCALIAHFLRCCY